MGSDLISYVSCFFRFHNRSVWWDPTFQVWTFDISKGDPPEFVIRSDRKFCVLIRKVIIKPMRDILKYFQKYSTRIVELDFSVSKLKGQQFVSDVFFTYLAQHGPVWKSLKYLSLGFYCWLSDTHNTVPMFNGCREKLSELTLCGINFFRQPYQNICLTNLKRLTLTSCYVDTMLLGQLAPNLKHIKLLNMKNHEFDVSKLDKQSGALSSLKSIFVFNSDLDVIGLISRSSKSLECLEIIQCKWLKVDQHLKDVRFPVLKSVIVRNGSGRNLMQFLAKAANTIENLELEVLKSQVNFASLVRHGMPKLKSLNIYMEKKTQNVHKIIEACPKLTNLTIGFGYRYLNDTPVRADTLTQSLSILQPLLVAAKSTSLQRLQIVINVCDLFQYSQRSAELKMDAIKTLDYASVRLSSRLPAVIVDPFVSLFHGDVDIQV